MKTFPYIFLALFFLTFSGGFAQQITTSAIPLIDLSNNPLNDLYKSVTGAGIDISKGYINENLNETKQKALENPKLGELWTAIKNIYHSADNFIQTKFGVDIPYIVKPVLGYIAKLFEFILNLIKIAISKL